ncbi:uncharacterized protein [Palaemon carinicauda]|uniref:uncharacterized protein n=1 Tax=Palaemon carinicauda TaxID=392227 RepID=UPI0035B63D51
MRISWILCAAVLFVALVGAKAGTVEYDENYDQPSCSNIWTVIEAFFRPTTNYLKRLPEKTLSDVVEDVRDNMNEKTKWVSYDALPKLPELSLAHQDWLREKVSVLKDKTFQEIYDDVMTQLLSLDEHWLPQGEQQGNSLAEYETFKF